MYLDKIIDYKKQELEHQRRQISLKDVRFKANDQMPARDFLGALKASQNSQKIKIIAEVKKASPSAGVIRPDFDALQIAQTYEENGAACLSILTDEHFFQGSLEILEKVKKHTKIPLLRKDFTLSDYHIYEARASGADAILLIARILEDGQIRDYSALAQDLGMTVLLEVHDVPEMERASGMKMPLIGINNRNLDTFQIDLATTAELAKLAPAGTMLVSESGISSVDHIRRIQESGVSAFLIGESFMREVDPGKKLRELLQH